MTIIHSTCRSKSDYRKEKYYELQGNKTDFEKERKGRLIYVSIVFDLHICQLGVFVIKDLPILSYLSVIQDFLAPAKLLHVMLT